MKTKWYSLYNF